MPQPALKTQEILNEVNALQEKRGKFEKIDEFTLKRLKNETGKILSKDALSAYMFFGIIGVLENDIEEVHINFKKALNLSKAPLVYSNYSAALDNMGYYSQAFELLKNVEVTSSKMLLDLLLVGIVSGRFHETQSLMKKWKYYLDQYPNPNELPSLEFIERVAAFMDDKGVSDDDLQKLVEVTLEVAHQRGIFVFNIAYQLYPDEDTFCLEYWIEIPVEVEVAVELNIQLAHAIVEQCPSVIAEQTGFVSLFVATRDQ